MSTDIVARLGAALAGRYRLERELGAGGMATVYLAHDLRHDRQVAIKVLRPELAAVIGGERFLTEVRTTAGLQHPHILPLHDSGEADSFLFYVMPFVEGESLRDRLDRERQLPVADAIRIAGEVADALDYAHRRGIVHRDIKPENILLHEGRALVADFGIALAVKQAGGARLTQTGMSLGTPAYMAPEQAMGERTLDARADVYALGAMTYEMLAGEPPFTGPTAQAIITRAMTEHPRPLAESRESVTPGIAAAVHRALQKLPADRWSSAREFREALATADLAPGGMREARPDRRAAGRANAVLGAVALVATVAAVWGWGRRPAVPEPPPPSRLSVITAPLGGASNSLLRQVGLSPDGRTLLYAERSDDGGSRTMVRPLDASTATPMSDVPPSTGGYVFSWDGSEFLGVGLDRRATRYAVRGGPPRTLQFASNADLTEFAAWAPDGTIWLSRAGGGSGLVHLVERDSVVPLGPATAGFLMQQVLDDNRSALVVRGTQGAAYGDLGLVDLRSGESRRLLDLPVVEARYASGFLVCVLQDGTLSAVPFDPAAGRVTGDPVDLAKDVAVTGAGIAQFAVSRTGVVAYVPEQPRSLVLVDRLGRARSATPEQRNFHAPQFSPDGVRIATDFNTTDGRDVWVLTLADGLLARATFDRDGHDAIWAPDGRSLTYVSSVGTELDLRRTRIGSTATPDSLLRARELMTTGTWLADGSALVTAVTSLGGNTGQDIGIVRNAGRGPIEPLVATPAFEQYPAVSPDGRWLAFTSDLSGREEVYVRPLGADGDQVQVSVSGGSEPVWAPEGGELFYRSELPSPSLNVATLRDAGGALQVTGRQVLFGAHDYVSATPHANYDVAPDGRGFVMVRVNPAREIVVLQGLPDLVRHLRDGRP